MSDIIIKYFILYLFSICIYYRLLNHRICSTALKTTLFVVCILLAFLTYCMKIYCPVISDSCPVMLLWLVLGVQSDSPKLSFVTAIISFGISYAFFVVSCGLGLLIWTTRYYGQTAFSYVYLILTAGVIECFILLILFRIKRFRNGMPFLYNAAFLNVGTFVCLTGLSLLTCLELSGHVHLWVIFFTPIAFIIAIPILIQWWQAQLTKSYLDRLRALELESLRDELQEKIAQVSRLQEDNEVMGRLIHKDNKLIPSMANAVYEYLTSSDNIDTEKRMDYGNQLLNELRHMTESREKILATLSISELYHSSTGIAALDALISYMGKRAKLADIKFTANISETINLSAVSSRMLTEDMVHLLADLIENAIIATSDCIIRSIQLRIDQYNKAMRIEISDTGIPFEISSLLDFGLEPCTTHSDTGGTGIGLMDIWKIKEKYRASLYVIEYNEPGSFTKKLIILLDNKNQYLISSWRAKEIVPQIRRADIHVLNV